ncbi:MAG: hypothetical protein ACYTHM_02775 [Planctomycetota bacterium]|jgi:hypothetical protein
MVVIRPTADTCPRCGAKKTTTVEHPSKQACERDRQYKWHFRDAHHHHLCTACGHEWETPLR